MSDELRLAAQALRGVAALLEAKAEAPTEQELTPSEVAAELGTSVTWVTAQCRTGALVARRYGPRMWRVSRQALDAFKARRTTRRSA